MIRDMIENNQNKDEIKKDENKCQKVKMNVKK
jgi:hypothetical protein